MHNTHRNILNSCCFVQCNIYIIYDVILNDLISSLSIYENGVAENGRVTGNIIIIFSYPTLFEDLIRLLASSSQATQRLE